MPRYHRRLRRRDSGSASVVSLNPSHPVPVKKKKYIIILTLYRRVLALSTYWWIYPFWMCCFRLPLCYGIWTKRNLPRKTQTKNNQHTQNILTFPPQLSHSCRRATASFSWCCNFSTFLSLSPRFFATFTHWQRIRKKKNFQQVTSLSLSLDDSS